MCVTTAYSGDKCVALADSRLIAAFVLPHTVKDNRNTASRTMKIILRLTLMVENLKLSLLFALRGLTGKQRK
jgi:hypothetical protein